MSINEEKLMIWCNQVDKRLDRLEGKNRKSDEPLIKDEQIRKVIRAWAEVNGLDSMPIYYDANYNRFCDDRDFSVSIDFYREVEGELLGEHSYYLTELCGEEE